MTSFKSGDQGKFDQVFNFINKYTDELLMETHNKINVLEDTAILVDDRIEVARLLGQNEAMNKIHGFMSGLLSD